MKKVTLGHSRKFNTNSYPEDGAHRFTENRNSHDFGNISVDVLKKPRTTSDHSQKASRHALLFPEAVGRIKNIKTNTYPEAEAHRYMKQNK